MVLGRLILGCVLCVVVSSNVMPPYSVYQTVSNFGIRHRSLITEFSIWRWVYRKLFFSQTTCVRFKILFTETSRVNDIEGLSERSMFTSEDGLPPTNVKFLHDNYLMLLLLSTILITLSLSHLLDFLNLQHNCLHFYTTIFLSVTQI